MLDQLINWIDEVPPIEQPQRFGNKAFKTWLNKVKDVSNLYVLKLSARTFNDSTFIKIECQSTYEKLQY